jgi:putative YhdH/YhfP family quinone oxidoreductase
MDATKTKTQTFPAFIAEDRDGRVSGRVGRIGLDDLPRGDVTIEVEYSSLNFKDALAATGQNKVAAGYPHVPGIDAAGIVAHSDHPDWTPGDCVLVTAYDFGAGRWGGYARFARVPHDWIVRTPPSLSSFEAMAIGTAGYTAAMSLEAIAHNGTKPGDGPILVTGATGGVGCLAVDLFAAAGYQVAASTGKPELHDWLRTLGATEILSREEVTLQDEEPRHLMRARWAGAVDNVGGRTLDHLLRTTQAYGNIAACGLVGGSTFRGTMMPFLLRGVNLLGIDSGHVPIATRQALWNRLATDLRPRHLDLVAREITLADLPDAIATILQGRLHGRLVVSLED